MRSTSCEVSSRTCGSVSGSRTGLHSRSTARSCQTALVALERRGGDRRRGRAARRPVASNCCRRRHGSRQRSGGGLQGWGSSARLPAARSRWRALAGADAARPRRTAASRAHSSVVCPARARWMAMAVPKAPPPMTLHAMAVWRRDRAGQWRRRSQAFATGGERRRRPAWCLQYLAWRSGIANDQRLAPGRSSYAQARPRS